MAKIVESVRVQEFRLECSENGALILDDTPVPLKRKFTTPDRDGEELDSALKSVKEGDTVYLRIREVS